MKTGKELYSEMPITRDEISDWLDSVLLIARNEGRVDQVCEMFLCESVRLILRADQLYKFKVDPICAMCNRLHEEGKLPTERKVDELKKGMGGVKPIEPVYRQFGAKVESLRSTLGWNQIDLAKKVGLTRGSIANIETGRQRILLADVEVFAKAFGMEPKHLMRGIWT